MITALKTLLVFCMLFVFWVLIFLMCRDALDIDVSTSLAIAGCFSTFAGVIGAVVLMKVST